MSHPGDNWRLLDDVFAEATPDEFRAGLLRETLRLARRRRGVRQARRVAAVVAVAIAIGAIAWRIVPTQPPVAPPLARAAVAASAYSVVSTAPLPASDLVSTQPFARDAVVASAPSVAIVETLRGVGFRMLNDDELLASVAPRRAVLVRMGPHAQELIFLPSPEQRN